MIDPTIRERVEPHQDENLQSNQNLQGIPAVDPIQQFLDECAAYFSQPRSY
jgi:hypothetical protein